MVTCSRLPSEDGSVLSNESAKPHSGRGSTALKVPTQQKMTKEETRKRNGETERPDPERVEAIILHSLISTVCLLSCHSSSHSVSTSLPPSLPLSLSFS